jgi:hypothetical protein
MDQRWMVKIFFEKGRKWKKNGEAQTKIVRRWRE